jgi:NADPH-dependent curcumin reductase CurA
MPVPGADEILVRNRYLSVDTINRAWMRPEHTYLPPQALGDVVRGIGLGIVTISNQPDVPVGATVIGAFGWQDFAVASKDSEFFMQLPNESHVSATMNLALFGPVGLTAYFGLTEVTRPRPGEVVVVSAAGGAVGKPGGPDWEGSRLPSCRHHRLRAELSVAD